MSKAYKPRKKISFVVLIIIGLVIGFAIKRVALGLIIGLAIGLLASGMMDGGRNDK